MLFYERKPDESQPPTPTDSDSSQNESSAAEQGPPTTHDVEDVAEEDEFPDEIDRDDGPLSAFDGMPRAKRIRALLALAMGAGEVN